MCQAVSIKSVETVELYSVDEGGETWKVKQYPDIKRVRCHNFSLTISAPVQTVFLKKVVLHLMLFPSGNGYFLPPLTRAYIIYF